MKKIHEPQHRKEPKDFKKTQGEEGILIGYKKDVGPPQFVNYKENPNPSNAIIVGKAGEGVSTKIKKPIFSGRDTILPW
jgi:hypothetical protein